MYPKPPETMPGDTPPPVEGVIQAPPPPATGVAEGRPVPPGPTPLAYPQAPAYAYQPGLLPPPPPIYVPMGGFAGVAVAPARVPPLTGQVVVGWEITDPDDVKCCGCETLNFAGWFTVVMLILFCLPFLAWIPCVLRECHYQVQRPIYGYPGAPPGQQQQGATGPSAPYPPSVYAEHV